MNLIRKDDRKEEPVSSNTMSKKTMSKGRNIAYIIGLAIIFVAMLLLFSVKWVYFTYGNISLDSIIYQMNAPMTGTSPTYFISYGVQALLPAVIVLLVIILLTGRVGHAIARLIGKKAKSVYQGYEKTSGFLHRFMLHASIVVLIISGTYIVEACDMIDYIKNKSVESQIYEEYYVDPETAELTFPEKKKNLIYLYVESLEKSLESQDVGGGKKDNIIPNLTQIQKENVAPADADGKQAHTLNGGTWTIAGMVSQTASVPLMFGINGMDYNRNGKFLPGAYSLGQVLKDQGYHNEMITGCEGEFAGTDLYLKQHGDYEILDPAAAVEKGYIPEGYCKNWGFEDITMFEILKQEITQKYEAGILFNITAATMDSHGDDVYICDKCDPSYTDDHDKVFHCTDDQVSEFVRWFEQQPCYEDTTLVISGDHLSMTNHYYDDCKDYQRTVFNVFVNPSVDKNVSYTKTYCTLDMYPSTLAALGVKIKGERLGLGTNLFSDQPTLCEVIGRDEFNSKLAQSSSFYNDVLMKGKKEEYYNKEQ